MAVQKDGYVYILANKSRGMLYVGVTSDLVQRIYQHKHGLGSTFTRRYGLKCLVYYEHIGNMYESISREKQLKAGSRKKKIELIESMNPDWKDLYNDIL